MKQNHELKENEGGILEMYVNNHPCVCPFAGQTVFPVPSQIMGKMDLQVFTKKCDSLCPLMEITHHYPEKDSTSVSLRCSFGVPTFENINVVPFNKKSNLTIH